MIKQTLTYQATNAEWNMFESKIEQEQVGTHACLDPAGFAMPEFLSATFAKPSSLRWPMMSMPRLVSIDQHDDLPILYTAQCVPALDVHTMIYIEHLDSSDA